MSTDGADALTGTMLSSRYKLVKEIGRGGMGAVFLAVDTVLQREVAVKLVRAGLLDAQLLERFEREARVTARLDHPSIVPVHDVGEHDGAHFLVMPLVVGEDLRSLVSKRALALGDILEIGLQVARALDYSHAQGVVHRDVKPENILVSRRPGEGLRVRVTDFGLAVASFDHRITQTGWMMGTPAYLSPEQIAGGEVCGAADVWGLGIALYECLAGEAPFHGGFHVVAYRIVNDAAPPLRSHAARVDEELEALVMSCLSKDPALRPTAGELAARLSAYRSGLAAGESARVILPAPAPGPRAMGAVFVGRARELEELSRRLAAAARGECQLVVIEGEAGIGKSRLLDELEAAARMREVTVLHGRLAESTRGFPYQGYCEALQEFLRSAPAASRPDLGDLLPELVALFPALAEVVPSLSSAMRPSGPAAPPQFEDRNRIFEVLSRSFARIAAARPLVLLLEDLHGADVSLAALDYLVGRLGATPALVVGTFRPEEVDRDHALNRLLTALEGDRRFARIRLEPFTAGDHDALVRALLGGGRLAADLPDRLLAASEGNPYFTRELVRSMLDSGALARDASGAWSLRGRDALSSQALPATIQQAVSRRLERLSDDQRELLARAAVLGRSFAVDELALLEPDADLDRRLERLLHDGFLEEERVARGDRLAFSSGVLREVVYGGLPRWRRRQLHREAAEGLERSHASRLERVSPRLLHHFTQAEVGAKVVEYGLKLARKALAAFSAEDAERAVRAALPFLDEDSGSGAVAQAEARLVLARALRMAGRREPAIEEFEAAARLAGGEGGDSLALMATAEAADLAWEWRRVDRVRALVERGLPLARSLEDLPTRRALLSLGSAVANLAGDQARSRLYADEVDGLPPEAAADGEEAPAGGTLRVGLAVEARATHPGDVRFDDELEILSNVFETLVRLDRGGNPMPGLAESWESLERGAVFRFRLRRGVRFHDGHELAAGDVSGALEAIARRAGTRVHAGLRAISGTEAYLAGEAARIAGLRAEGDDTVEIRLTERLPLFPSLLVDPCLAIAREREGGGGWVGTGPFRLVSSASGQVRLERSESWWRGKPPRIEAVEFSTGLSSAEMAARMRDGSLDLARDLQPADLEALLAGRLLRATLVEAPKHNVYFAILNTVAGPLADPALRRVVRRSVAVRDLVRRTLGRLAEPAEGLLPPGIFGHDPTRRARPLDADEARRRLTAAGFEPPLRLRTAVHPTLSDRYASLLDGLRRAWAEVGVEIDVRTQTMDQFLAAEERPADFDMILGRYVADYNDPDNFCYQLFHSVAGVYRRYCSGPELDARIEAARAETWQGERARQYRSIEQRLLESDGLLPLFHDIDARVASPLVRRLALASTPPYVNYAEVGVERGGVAVTRQGRGGVVRVPLAAALEQLDPARTILVQEAEVCQAIFEMLTREVEGARIVPWLASEVVPECSGAVYRFRLRDDVRFHDGRALTARDVAWSFERLLLDTESEARSLLSPIRGARALLEGRTSSLEGLHIHSNQELSIDLEEPVAFFPALLAYYGAAIVPEGTVRFAGSWRDGCVGTGPFRIARFEPGRRVELEANPHYWRPGFPRCDSVVFSLGVSPEQAADGFRAGRYALVWDLPPAEVAALRRDVALAATCRECPSLSTYMLVANARSGVLANPVLRRRLIDAVDVEDLVATTVPSVAMPARGLIPPGLLGHRSHPRPARPTARDTVGQRVELRGMLHGIYDTTLHAVGEAVLAALDRAGFDVEIVPERFDKPGWHDAAIDFLLARWIADYPDPDTFLNGFAHSANGVAGSLCGTAELDELIEQARRETDPEARGELYGRAEDLIAGEALLLPLFHEQAVRLARPEVADFAVTFSGPHVVYEKLWLRG